MVHRAKSLKMSFGHDVQTDPTPAKQLQGIANTRSTSQASQNVALSKAVLEEARITREKMNKRINACQLDFTYPPVFHSAERSSLDLTFDRRSDYKTIFSEDELENLGIVGRQAQNNANILQSLEAQRQPSCLLDKPLPPSRFSEAKASGDRGRICAPAPTNLLDFFGSFNRLCCSSARNGPDQNPRSSMPSNGADSDLDHRLRVWESALCLEPMRTRILTASSAARRTACIAALLPPCPPPSPPQPAAVTPAGPTSSSRPPPLHRRFAPPRRRWALT